MQTIVASVHELEISMEYPDHWHGTKNAVPSLAFPQEAFAVGNQPIPSTPEQSDQPRPMVTEMQNDGLLLWLYVQALDDGDGVSKAEMPDFSMFKLPLDYDYAQAFPGYNAREWAGTDFVWKRLGVHTEADLWVTVWIWEGTAASAEDVDDARKTVASVTVRSNRT